MMKPRIHAVLAFSVLLASSTALAADWVSIGKSKDGKQEFFVDTSSIRVRYGDIRAAWVKTVYVPHTMRTPDKPKKWWDYTVIREAIDCADGNASNEAVTIYYADGTTFMVPDYALPVGGEPIPPETVAEAVMKFVCSWKME